MREHFGNKMKNDGNDRPNLDPRVSQASQVSKLTDELVLSDQEHGHGHEDAESRGDGDRSEVMCKQCGGGEFKIRFVGGEKVLACGRCGVVVEEEIEGEVGQEKDGVRRKDEKGEVVVGVDQNPYRRFYT